MALLLPWMAGAALLGAFLPAARLTILLGQGFMVGQVLVVLVLLAVHALGLGVSFLPGAVALTVVAFASAVTWWARTNRVMPSWPGRSAGWHLLWLIPLTWFLFERGTVLAGELALRPLYAWDAWMNWAPKAVVWFNHATLTPFVSPADWLQAAPGEPVYTLGNWRAAEYPPGVPLILLWMMLGAGSADHTLIYLPWFLLPVSLALALWGHLRNRSAAPWLAALAVYAWLSQPLPGIHAALAGYADLWLAVAFCLGAMALDEWQSTGCVRYAALALVMALACSLFKIPGLAMAGILLVAAVILVARPSIRVLATATIIVAACLVAGLIAGMWPGLWVQGDTPTELGLPGTLPTLRIEPSPLLPYLWESLFVQANWHLLWLLVLGSLGLGLVDRGSAILRSIPLLVLFAGSGFLLFVFGFTHYFNQAVNGVTFNRAILFLAPIAVYVAFGQLVPWFQRSPDSDESGA